MRRFQLCKETGGKGRKQAGMGRASQRVRRTPRTPRRMRRRFGDAWEGKENVSGGGKDSSQGKEDSSEGEEDSSEGEEDV